MSLKCIWIFLHMKMINDKKWTRRQIVSHCFPSQATPALCGRESVIVWRRVLCDLPLWLALVVLCAQSSVTAPWAFPPKQSLCSQLHLWSDLRLKDKRRNVLRGRKVLRTGQLFSSSGRVRGLLQTWMRSLSRHLTTPPPILLGGEGPCQLGSFHNSSHQNKHISWKKERWAW